MKETIKKSFIGGIVFLGTVLTGFFAFAAYTSLPTQNSGDTITQTIWNDVINKINGIGNNVDTLSGTVNALTRNAGLGVGQTRQDLNSSRVLGTTYTNNTGKPILWISGTNNNGNAQTMTWYIDGIVVASAASNANAVGTNLVDTFIVPNGSTYKLTGVAKNTWSELR